MNSTLSDAQARMGMVPSHTFSTIVRIVSWKVGNSSGLSRRVPYASHMPARKMMITALRTKPSFHNSSSVVSLRSTSTAATVAATASLRSRIFASPISALLMCRCRLGEEEIVDLLLQPSGAAVLAGDPIDVDDFRPHPARMRRQQQNAVADLDRLGDRMGHEQHGEFGLRPELQQFVLAGAAGQRVQGGE